MKSHFQIAITRKVFKLAPSKFPNFTLSFVAASLKACGKLNIKARDLILYTDLPMYALYIVLKNCTNVMNGLEDIKA